MLPDQAQECENLMRVVRELTESRSKLVAGKSIMAERFAELQAEYLKVGNQAPICLPAIPALDCCRPST